ncbi:MAG: PriCT-2 domain-containing protein, partial [Sediminibacterium sp.]
MSNDIEILETSATDGWDAKKMMEWERAKAIVERTESKHLDITEKLNGSLWTQLGNCFAWFGESARVWFHRLSKLSEEYTEGECDAKFDWCMKHSKAKSLYHLTGACKKNDIDTSLPDGSEVDVRAFIPPDADASAGNDVTEYGFFAMKNKYYKMTKTDKGWKYEDFTNFVLKIKYHIYDKMQPKRIFEIKNSFNKKITVDAPTDVFASKNNFKKFIEGLGNFLFDGSEVDLSRIKRKLYSEEKECYMIDVLGWNRRGFWAWSNGIYFNGTFIPCDDDGIVEL